MTEEKMWSLIPDLDVYKNETGTSWASFYLVSGYDYANGIIQASITKKGKELIDKLRGMEDER